MRQKETGVIAVPPEAVWPWIADPERVAQWNSKLEVTGAPPLEDLREGISYGARYRLRRAVEVQALVEVCDPPRELVVRYRFGPDSWALERATLEATGEGTRLTRTVEILDPRIPWPARLLAGLIMRFGKPVAEGHPKTGKRNGGTHVDAIRALCEQ
jgi:uncharacterized protein YndB with AHSA1/START domain